MAVKLDGTIIDEQGDPTGGQVNVATGALSSGPIGTASLTGVPTPSFQTTSYPTPYPVGGLVAQPLGTEEQKAQDASNRIQDLNKALIGESDYQAQQNQVQGVGKYKTTMDDLGAQLQGLVNQSLDLDNQYNYTVPNKMQEGATGRGITAGGLAPIQASELRKIQIQKGGIASQALTVKSAFEAAQGNLTTAQYYADEAVKQKFGRAKEELKALTANLDVILKSPAYTNEEKKRAQAQKDIQDKKDADIKKQEEQYKTTQAMATAAMVLNPGNQAASFAAQQALKLDPADPEYFSKMFALVGQYQSDPVATKNALLAQQKAELDIKKTELDTAYAKEKNPIELAKLKADIAKVNADIAKVNADAIVAGKDRKLVKIDGKDYYQEADGSLTTPEVPDAITPEETQIKYDTIITSAQAILDDPNLSNAVGAKSALTPMWLRSGVRNAVDGKIANLIAKVAIENLGWLKGPLSDKDILFVKEASTKINVNQDEAGFKKHLEELIESTKRLKKKPQGVTGTLPNGTVVTKNTDGTITDAQGNKYDENGNKI